MNPPDDSLFAAAPGHEPLASRMRPRTIEEFIGQDHIMGPGRLLRRAIQADQLSSVIFSGPPGTGKTTLARVIAGSTRSDFISLNAVLAGVAEIRESIEKAKAQKQFHDRRTILFVDEVHRWNKSQQDALLPWVENGTFILIGATTENPYFEVNAALVSRSRVFQLTALSADNLRDIARQALGDLFRGYGNWRVSFDPEALDHLVHTAAGDARSLLNALELAVETTPASWPPPNGCPIHITLGVAEESIQQKALLYDKEGDYHFDTISAFIKSLRGSDPDAALYWLARMVRAGESPRFIFRRMMISASEDVGLADPQALVQVQSAAAAFDRVGLPEGQFFLSQAALYLATAPKSNSALGYFEALKTVEAEASAEVPNHLKDSSRDKKGFGHGEGYQYPHAFRDHWVAQNYLPPPLQGRLFYQPGELGHEGGLRPGILRRRELQLAEAVESESVENLSFSPQDRSLLHFTRRANAGTDPWLAKVRQLTLDRLQAARHHRLAIVGAESGFLLPEALRAVPEGLVYGLFPERQLAPMAHQLEQAGMDGHCRLLPREGPAGRTEPWPEGPAERLAAFNLLSRSGPSENRQLLASLASQAAPGCRLVLAEQIPAANQRLAALARSAADTPGETVFLDRVADAEEVFYAAQPDAAAFLALFAPAGDGGPAPAAWAETDGCPSWSVLDHELIEVPRKRLVDPGLIDAWLSPGRPGGYAHAVSETLGEEGFSAWVDLARRRLSGRTLDWPVAMLLARAVRSGHSLP